jgi:hypothetical protein
LNIKLLQKDSSLFFKVFETFSFQHVACIAFLCFFSLLSHSQTDNQFLGAEMYYESIEDSQLKVTLITYSTCDSKVSDSEKVSLFKGENMNPKIDLELAKDTSSRIESLSKTMCSASNSICYIKTSYSGITTCDYSEAGYNLVWEEKSIGYGDWMNLHMMQESGIHLLVKVIQNPNLINKHAAVFNEDPDFITCISEPFKANYKGRDIENDSIHVEFSQPLSFKVKNRPIGVDFNDPNLFPGIDLSYPMFPPPYELIKYAENCTPSKPFGKGKVSVNDLGETEFYIQDMGGYLIGLTISEFRDGELINSYQRVFRLLAKS